jgi:hypothetical protein
MGQKESAVRVARLPLTAVTIASIVPLTALSYGAPHGEERG